MFQSFQMIQEPRTNPTCPFGIQRYLGLMNWMWTGSAMKSICEMKNLIDFLKSDQFKKEDLENFDIRAETAKFDRYTEGSSSSHPGTRHTVHNYISQRWLA